MKKAFSTQKGFAHILSLLLLIIGLVATVYLVNFTITNLSPKANEENYVKFYDIKNPNGDPVTEIQGSKVLMELAELPENWRLPEWVSPASIVGDKAFSQYVEQTYETIVCPVDESCCKQPLTQESRCDSNDDCNKIDPNFGWCYNSVCINSNYSGSGACSENISDIPPAVEPLPNVETEKHVLKQVNVYKIANDGAPEQILEITRKNKDFGLSKKLNLQLIPIYHTISSSDVLLRVVLIAEDGCTNTYNTHGCYTKTFHYNIKIVPGGQSESDTKSEGLPNVDQSTQTEAKDSPNIPDIFKEGDLNQIPVEINIHSSLEYGRTSAFAQNTIDNLINPLFKKAGKRLKIVSTNSITDTICPNGYTTKCPYSDSTIRIYLYPSQGFWTNPLGDEKHLGVAYPKLLQVGLKLKYSGTDRDSVYLTHEIAHLFGVPDYYLEAVDRNDVLPGNNIKPFIQDVMSGGITLNQEKMLSNVSISIVKAINKIPLEGPDNVFAPDILAWSFVPTDTIIKVVDKDNKPVQGALVEVFPQTIENKELVIKRDAPIKFTTDNTGRAELGNYNNFMKRNQDSFVGHSAFIKVSKDNQVKYSSITRSFLNKLFFENRISNAEVLLKFTEKSPLYTPFGYSPEEFSEQDYNTELDEFLRSEKQGYMDN